MKLNLCLDEVLENVPLWIIWCEILFSHYQKCCALSIRDKRAFCNCSSVKFNSDVVIFGRIVNIGAKAIKTKLNPFNQFASAKILSQSNVEY